jgi:hypothetical protein
MKYATVAGSDWSRENILGFGGAIVRASAFHLWDRWFDSRYGLMHDTYVKRVSQRSTESRGFSPGTPVSSHRECWQGGLGLSP